jgi:3-isopropylmalate dehydrogenase
MAQATHGSAPDIAGRNVANPYAMIMSGKMLLEWLGHKNNEPSAIKAADLIEVAMEEVIAEQKHLTVDLGGGAGTTQMGDAVASAI